VNSIGVCLLHQTRESPEDDRKPTTPNPRIVGGIYLKTSDLRFVDKDTWGGVRLHPAVGEHPPTPLVSLNSIQAAEKRESTVELETGVARTRGVARLWSKLSGGELCDMTDSVVIKPQKSRTRSTGRDSEFPSMPSWLDLLRKSRVADTSETTAPDLNSSTISRFELTDFYTPSNLPRVKKPGGYPRYGVSPRGVELRDPSSSKSTQQQRSKRHPTQQDGRGRRIISSGDTLSWTPPTLGQSKILLPDPSSRAES